jgi:hypothetical protein
MINEYDALGEITKDATFRVYNIDALNQYLSENKGTRVMLKIVPCGTVSVNLIGYYKNVIVPMFQRGYFSKGNFYTCQQVDQMLREMSCLCLRESYDEDSHKWIQEVKDVHELTNFDLIYFIVQLKVKAAEEFCIFIDDPKTL